MEKRAVDQRYNCSNEEWVYRGLTWVNYMWMHHVEWLTDEESEAYEEDEFKELLGRSTRITISEE
ncbi:hypothetical protein AR543_p0146 (plasmid) [Paenibacillus bovis]|uniref:Uncharacterized protein n=1 Tax=Paenibacillus bovis TaxID=1616788 RepID=A0A1X9T4D8_9BACL|nr:hypothetical protein AR543_p0146 [Paenibacillus bovis]